jgi:hypothetical protein
MTTIQVPPGAPNGPATERLRYIINGAVGVDGITSHGWRLD